MALSSWCAAIEYNLSYGAYGAGGGGGGGGSAPTRQQVEQAAREAAAHAFISALPLGYDTEVRWRQSHSGARAYIRALLRRVHARSACVCSRCCARSTDTRAQVTHALN